MPILLAHLSLPAGLRWVDEYAAPDVDQMVRRRLSGAISIFPRANVAGRPITLEADAEHWITRAEADALLALASVAGATYPLTFQERGGVAYTVCFRHHDAPALDLRPLLDFADPAADDPIIGAVKLMTL